MQLCEFRADEQQVEDRERRVVPVAADIQRLHLRCVGLLVGAAVDCALEVRCRAVAPTDLDVPVQLPLRDLGPLLVDLEVNPQEVVPVVERLERDRRQRVLDDAGVDLERERADHRRSGAATRRHAAWRRRGGRVLSRHGV